MRVIVGSLSDRKIEAVSRAMRTAFHGHVIGVTGVKVASEVPETPWNEEIATGARNRATGARRRDIEADLWIGLETGLVVRQGAVYEETWCCVLWMQAESTEVRDAIAYSSGLPVPKWVLDRMQTLGLSHCETMTVIERERGLPNDTLATYTGGLLRRDTALEEAARNALVLARGE